jgi:hypothetical protein
MRSDFLFGVHRVFIRELQHYSFSIFVGRLKIIIGKKLTKEDMAKLNFVEKPLDNATGMR